jgi:hypothetical protein
MISRASTNNVGSTRSLTPMDRFLRNGMDIDLLLLWIGMA